MAQMGLLEKGDTTRVVSDSRLKQECNTVQTKLNDACQNREREERDKTRRRNDAECARHCSGGEEMIWLQPRLKSGLVELFA